MKQRDEPHVAILMATRNGALHLQAQLHSIAAQTHRNWHLWVSDDGSTDETRDIVHDFAASHPVTLLQGPCQGSSAANFLSLICHPDLPVGTIALADQDDVWLEGKLARALRRMSREPADAPVLYAAESVLTDERLTPVSVSRAHGARPGFANALVQNLFGGHTTVFNAHAHALLRRAGRPDGIAFHDWWIYQLIAGAGGHLALDRRPTAMYRQHRGNAIGGAGGLFATAKRLNMTLRRDFARMMEAQAEALSQVSHVLTPEARGLLEEFRHAPRSGPQRVAMLRRLGIQRASRAGTAAFLTAALFGRM